MLQNISFDVIRYVFYIKNTFIIFTVYCKMAGQTPAEVSTL